MTDYAAIDSRLHRAQFEPRPQRASCTPAPLRGLLGAAA